MKKMLIKPISFGFSASVLLLALYFFVMALAQSSFSSALAQLSALKFWVVLLVGTFGVQVGLFVYVRECSKSVSGTSTTVGAATSSVAMVACCAHHATDVLPLVGLSVLATFLAKYQVWFFALGVLSNLVGIVIMFKRIRTMKI